MNIPFSIISDKRLQAIKDASFEEGVRSTLDKDPVKLAEQMGRESEFNAVFDFSQVVSITRKFIGSSKETTVLERRKGFNWTWPCNMAKHNSLVKAFQGYQQGANKGT